MLEDLSCYYLEPLILTIFSELFPSCHLKITHRFHSLEINLASYLVLYFLHVSMAIKDSWFVAVVCQQSNVTTILL